MSKRCAVTAGSPREVQRRHRVDAWCPLHGIATDLDNVPTKLLSSSDDRVGDTVDFDVRPLKEIAAVTIDSSLLFDSSLPR
jgi:hypothetical protein